MLQRFLNFCKTRTPLPIFFLKTFNLQNVSRYYNQYFNTYFIIQIKTFRALLDDSG